MGLHHAFGLAGGARRIHDDKIIVSVDFDLGPAVIGATSQKIRIIGMRFISSFAYTNDLDMFFL